MNTIFYVLSSTIFVGAITYDTNGNYNQLTEFNYRRKQKQHERGSIGRCVLNFLQRVDEDDNFTLTKDFVAKKDDKVAARSLVNLFDTDPVDFRGILENAGAVMGQRSLEWHMDSIYPGLMFKIGPTSDTNSVAEFILDVPENERTFAFEEPTTARTLTKLYLLPLLLGLKLNLAALVPLVFTAVCLLLKKSLFLVKLIFYLSTVLGVGGFGSVLSSLGGLGLGGLGGLGNLGFRGGQLADIKTPVSNRPVAAAWDQFSGAIPQKQTIYNGEYEDVYTSSPYKRNERKIKYEKPRELISTTPSTRPADHFYDYENQFFNIPDRSSQKQTEKKTEPEQSFHTHFSNKDVLGWNVVNLNA